MNYEWTMNYGEMDVSYRGMSERKTTCELNLEDGGTIRIMYECSNGTNTAWNDLFSPLYYYMRNFCNLIGLEQWYFSLIWNTYMWKLQTFGGSSINK